MYPLPDSLSQEEFGTDYGYVDAYSESEYSESESGHESKSSKHEDSGESGDVTKAPKHADYELDYEYKEEVAKGLDPEVAKI